MTHGQAALTKDEIVKDIALAQEALFRAARRLAAVHPALTQTTQYKELDTAARALMPVMQSVSKMHI